MPGEHCELAGCRAERDLLAAADGDAAVKGVQWAGGTDRGVCGLDQQTAGVCLPGARDVTVAGSLLTGLADPRVKAQVADQMPRGSETA
jgi:hypothetical protein